MNWFSNIPILLFSIAFLIQGVLLITNSTIRLMITKKCINLNENKKHDLAKQLGKIVILLGISIFMTYLVNSIFTTYLGYIFIAIGIILYFVLMFKVQNKYKNMNT